MFYNFQRKGVKEKLNANKFKAKLVELGLNTDDMIKCLHVSKVTYYAKLKNNDFSVKDVELIAKKIKLTKDDIINIFFDSVKN